MSLKALAVGFGVLAIAAAGGAKYANRYQSNAYEEHRDRIVQAHERGDDDAIRREVERFHNDDRVDLAIDLLLPLHMIEVVAAMLAVGCWLLSS